MKCLGIVTVILCCCTFVHLNSVNKASDDDYIKVAEDENQAEEEEEVVAINDDKQKENSYFVPPQSGEYKFYSRCFSACEVSFGDDLSIPEEQIISIGDDDLAHRKGEIEKASHTMFLQQGQKYLVQTLHKSNDVPIIGALFPDSKKQMPISNQFLEKVSSKEVAQENQRIPDKVSDSKVKSTVTPKKKHLLKTTKVKVKSLLNKKLYKKLEQVGNFIKNMEKKKVQNEKFDTGINEVIKNFEERLKGNSLFNVIGVDRSNIENGLDSKERTIIKLIDALKKNLIAEDQERKKTEMMYQKQIKDLFREVSSLKKAVGLNNQDATASSRNLDENDNETYDADDRTEDEGYNHRSSNFPTKTGFKTRGRLESEFIDSDDNAGTEDNMEVAEHNQKNRQFPKSQHTPIKAGYRREGMLESDVEENDDDNDSNIDTAEHDQKNRHSPQIHHSPIRTGYKRQEKLESDVDENDDNLSESRNIPAYMHKPTEMKPGLMLTVKPTPANNDNIAKDQQKNVDGTLQKTSPNMSNMNKAFNNEHDSHVPQIVENRLNKSAQSSPTDGIANISVEKSEPDQAMNLEEKPDFLPNHQEVNIAPHLYHAFNNGPQLSISNQAMASPKQIENVMNRMGNVSSNGIREVSQLANSTSVSLNNLPSSDAFTSFVTKNGPDIGEIKPALDGFSHTGIFDEPQSNGITHIVPSHASGLSMTKGSKAIATVRKQDTENSPEDKSEVTEKTEGVLIDSSIASQTNTTVPANDTTVEIKEDDLKTLEHNLFSAFEDKVQKGAFKTPGGLLETNRNVTRERTGNVRNLEKSTGFISKKISPSTNPGWFDNLPARESNSENSDENESAKYLSADDRLKYVQSKHLLNDSLSLEKMDHLFSRKGVWEYFFNQKRKKDGNSWKQGKSTSKSRHNYLMQQEDEKENKGLENEKLSQYSPIVQENNDNPTVAASFKKEELQNKNDKNAKLTSYPQIAKTMMKRPIMSELVKPNHQSSFSENNRNLVEIKGKGITNTITNEQMQNLMISRFSAPKIRPTGSQTIASRYYKNQKIQGQTAPRKDDDLLQSIQLDEFDAAEQRTEKPKPHSRHSAKKAVVDAQNFSQPTEPTAILGNEAVEGQYLRKIRDLLGEINRLQEAVASIKRDKVYTFVDKKTLRKQLQIKQKLLQDLTKRARNYRKKMR